MTWTMSDIPNCTGKVAVVTGANSGLGLVVATELCRRGAHVVLGCRDTTRGEQALAQVRGSAGGSAELVRLDLAELASVRAAAEEVEERHLRVDLLVNNAGVMALPQRSTADGFEMQLGTNHLGHFALTGLLLPALLRSPSPRVVTVTSALHRRGRLDRADLMGAADYRPWTAYAQSKLANLLFAFELQRRCDAAGVRLLSVAAHPGYAATNLQQAGARMSGDRLRALGAGLLNAVLGQSAEKGAQSLLRAATDPAAAPADVFGPGGPGEMRGAPRRVGASAAAYDAQDAAWLWRRSVELTGVDFAALPVA